MAEPTRRRPAPDPAAVQETIDYLNTRTDKDFAEALADCIMDPVPDEVAAFRSPELAPRSLIAAQYLIDHAKTTIKYKEHEQTKKGAARGTARFRDEVKYELRLLEDIVRGERARLGIVDNAPNPRARALRRLKQRHLAEYQELTREEQAKIEEEKRQRKALRRQERAAERGQARSR